MHVEFKPGQVVTGKRVASFLSPRFIASLAVAALSFAATLSLRNQTVTTTGERPETSVGCTCATQVKGGGHHAGGGGTIKIGS
jgi:hypothetical protein